MQRAIELGELQYNALPWLPQKLALPVDMHTRWLHDERTAAAAGAMLIMQSLVNDSYGVRLSFPTLDGNGALFCRACLSEFGGARRHST